MRDFARPRRHEHCPFWMMTDSPWENLLAAMVRSHRFCPPVCLPLSNSLEKIKLSASPSEIRFWTRAENKWLQNQSISSEASASLLLMLLSLRCSPVRMTFHHHYIVERASKRTTTASWKSNRSDESDRIRSKIVFWPMHKNKRKTERAERKRENEWRKCANWFGLRKHLICCCGCCLFIRFFFALNSVFGCVFFAFFSFHFIYVIVADDGFSLTSFSAVSSSKQ